MWKVLYFQNVFPIPKPKDKQTVLSTLVVFFKIFLEMILTVVLLIRIPIVQTSGSSEQNLRKC